MEHGFAKGQCEKRAIIGKFPKDIQDFAEAFIILQERRQSADYDPASVFQDSEVEELIIRAEDAIARLARAPLADRRAFAALVVLRPNRR